MGRYNDLAGDPTEYNPDREDGQESTEDVPVPGEPEDTTRTVVLASECNWDGDAFWFDCPECGDRLNSGWFLNPSNSCDCGASISIRAVVRS